MLFTLVVSFLVLLAVRVPVAAAMGVSGVLALLSSDLQVPIAVVPQRIFVMLDSTSLLAIPFFIFAGALMEHGGISRWMLAFADTLVRHWRGGLAQVDVIASAIFSSLTGSSAASASATGSIMIPALRRAGYPAGYAAALETTGSVIGNVIPPSIIMVVYGALAGVSIGALFLAGIVPGLMIIAGMLLVNAIQARRHGWQRSERATWRERMRAGRDAVPALFVPIILMGGILGGIFTATEAGAVAVVYAMLIGFFVYRELDLAKFYRVSLAATKSTASIGIIIASAGIFGWVLALEQVPSKVAILIQSMTDQAWMAMLLVAVVVLIIGLFVETMAALIILVPIFAPLAGVYGIDPIHLGIVICLSLAYGALTPPVGVLLFITSRFADVSVMATIRAMAPFYIVLAAVLLVIGIFPGLALLLN